MDAFYRSFQNEVVPVCVNKGVGVIGMKSLGGGQTAARIPAKTGITAGQCVRYALSLPVSTLVRGYMSIEQLERDLRIARGFTPLSAAEMAAIRALAKPEAGDGRHELFKSTQVFDGVPHRKLHGFDLG